MTDFKINVIVDPTNADAGMSKVDARLIKTERNAQRLQRSMTRAFTLVGIIAAVRGIGQMADALTNARNRIRLVTTDTSQLNAVMEELFEISRRTRTSFEATSTIFSRTALSVRDLGLSQQETLAFTESLNQAIVLSGVKAQEANAGLIQLSQGLASGTLRGDELRSVLEQLPKVADVIAAHMGVTRGELRLLGQEGKISAENVIDAFKEAAVELKAAFATSIPTISQAFSVLRSSTIRFVGEIDSATGASEKLSRTIIALSENLVLLGKIALVVGAAFAGPLIKAGIAFATRAVIALGVAIAANPIGAIIIGVIAVVTALVQFADQITLTSDGFVTLQDVAIAAFDTIVEAVQPIIAILVEGFDTAITFIKEAFEKIPSILNKVLGYIRSFVNSLIGAFTGVGRAIASVFTDIRGIIIDLIGQDLINKLNGAVKASIDFVLKGFEVVQKFADNVLLTLGIIANEISNVVKGIELPDIEIPDIPIPDTLAKIGANAKAAFLDGFDQDFVGDFLTLITPAFDAVKGTVNSSFENFMAKARKISEERRKQESTTDAGLNDKSERSNRLPFALVEAIRLLELEGENLTLVNRERGVQNELLKIEEKLRSSNVTLTDPQRELLESKIRFITILREEAEVLDSIRDPQNELNNRQEILNTLYAKGSITLAEFNNQMQQLVFAQSALNVEQGNGAFADGFLLSIETMLTAVENFASDAGAAFGDFFAQSSAGFADAIGDALIFGTSIKDALGNVARQALAGLLSGLIKIGLQYALNATLGQSLAAASTAAAVGEAAIISTAFATPAALVSLATVGTNAVAAQAGILSTMAVANAAAVVGFANGGFVRGAGTGTSDSISANLSNGEFVVNAKSTARFRPQLEAMNNGGAANGSSNNSSGSSGSNNLNGSDVSQSGNSVSIINVFDPNLMEDYLTSSSGESVLVNVIERNSSSINQVLRNS